MTTEDSGRTIDMNGILSDILKYGVVVSTALVALGMVLTFAYTPTGFPDSLQQIISTNYGMPTTSPVDLFTGLGAASPSSVLQLGLILLLATPVARVAASAVIFMLEHDKKYVLITLFVLSVLLVSTFVIGPLEAAVAR
ncbi:MAG: DUF1634 domain-containing protein [Nitrososphaerota archaeon]|nr:DUF1634 domain-containing protein [Nitrososphaerota archaeon]